MSYTIKVEKTYNISDPHIIECQKIFEQYEILCQSTLFEGTCKCWPLNRSYDNQRIYRKKSGLIKLEKPCNHNNFTCNTCKLIICGCCYDYQCPCCKNNKSDEYISSDFPIKTICPSCEVEIFTKICPYCNLDISSLQN